jgi:hypothetical protein
MFFSTMIKKTTSISIFMFNISYGSEQNFDKNKKNKKNHSFEQSTYLKKSDLQNVLLIYATRENGMPLRTRTTLVVPQRVENSPCRVNQ